MTYRVVQWGTGRVGTDAVAGIVGHPDLDLAGAWVYSEAKDGRDVGEILGMGPLGVHATRDKDTILAGDADCILYAPARTWGQNPMATVDELARLLRAGKNVVNVAWPALVNPRGISQEVFDRLETAALAGGVTLYTAGIDPGFGSMGLALAAMTVTAEVRSVRMFEILNYAHWNNQEWIGSVLGFGRYQAGTLFTSGQLSSTFGPMLHLLAQSLGVELDGIVEAHHELLADEDFDVPAARVAKGTICGIRFEITGMVDGVPRLIVEHVTKLRDKDFAELAFQGGGYRVEIDGDPMVKLDMQLSWSHAAQGSIIGGGSGRPAIFATAMTAVNSIPQVCAAPPGVLVYTELLPHPSRNVARARGH